ncbi:TetR/AcrR family transcriptional regulator [Sphingomonas solaris]|nr:TetR/AcrR family transcriptional regulator [Sphingomonas solaris]
MDATIQRERILTAATTIFIARGFADGSVDAIGKVAGVTKRTIYELIGDKEAVFQAVCDGICARTGLSRFGPPSDTVPVRDVLLDMARTIVAAALAPESVAYNRMLAAELLRFPNIVLPVMEKSRRDIHGAIATVFADLMAQRRIAPGSASIAADTFYDTIVGAKALRAMLGFSEPVPQAVELERRVDMMMRGFLADDGGLEGPRA